MSAARFHVVARENQWRVEREGGLFAVTFDTKEEAVRAAETRARIAQPAVVIVHDEVGQEEDRFGYGDEGDSASSGWAG